MRDHLQMIWSLPSIATICIWFFNLSQFIMSEVDNFIYFTCTVRCRLAFHQICRFILPFCCITKYKYILTSKIIKVFRYKFSNLKKMWCYKKKLEHLVVVIVVVNNNAQKKARCCHQAFLALFLTDEKGSNDLLDSTLNSPSANVVVLVPLW